MSSINVLKQRHSVHLCTDSAGYDESGYIEQFIQKQCVLPSLHAVVATRGDPRGAFHVGMICAGLFESFDHMIEGVEGVMSEILDALPPNDLNPRNEIFIAGWSADRGRPEAYFLQTAANEWKPADGEQVAGDVLRVEPFKLLELSELTFTPAIEASAMIAAKPAGRKVSSPDDLDARVDLMRVMEIQRQQPYCRVAGGPERFWVGGSCTLTSITADGLHSHVIARWPEDKVGELIEPEPIDWDRWNREHPLPGAVEQLSRLREQMLAKKARKLAR